MSKEVRIPQGGGIFIEVRGCTTRQGVLFEDMCSLRVYFLPIFLVCAFQPHSKLCVPSGYTISRFFDRILCSLRVRVRVR